MHFKETHGAAPGQRTSWNLQFYFWTIDWLSVTTTSLSSSRSLVNTFVFTLVTLTVVIMIDLFFCAKWNSPGEKNKRVPRLVCVTFNCWRGDWTWLEFHENVRSCEFWVLESLRCEWVWSCLYPLTTHNSRSQWPWQSQKPPPTPPQPCELNRWSLSDETQVKSSCLHSALSLTLSYLKTWIITCTVAWNSIRS